MSDDIRKKLLALRQEVMRHEELYRKKNSPEISDFEYDKLVDQLADLEREYPQYAGTDLGIGDDQAEGFQQRDHASRCCRSITRTMKKNFNNSVNV
jgi:DNA ligase (NAD+)